MKRSRKSLKQGRSQMTKKLTKPKKKKKRRVARKSITREKARTMKGDLPEHTVVGMPEAMEAGTEATIIEEVSIGITLELALTEEEEEEKEEATMGEKEEATMGEKEEKVISTRDKTTTEEVEEDTMKEVEVAIEGEVGQTIMRGKCLLRRTITTRRTLKNLKSRTIIHLMSSLTLMDISL